VVFAFFFQGDVLGEAASDSLSQLGAAMISAWGVVALAKETWAPEAQTTGKPRQNPMENWKILAKSHGKLEHPGKIR
jgi:hypothetical protein